MKIDVAQITDYDSLSLEEKVAALENFEYDDHSEAVETLGKYKDATDKATREAAEYKKQLKALQDQQKTGNSKADDTIAKLQEQVAELTRQNTIASYTAQFTALGYDAELAQATAFATADGDVATVFENQRKFLEQHSSGSSPCRNAWHLLMSFLMNTRNSIRNNGGYRLWLLLHRPRLLLLLE